MSLFERELRDQVSAAQAALLDAETQADPVLMQAAENHLDSLLDLARRNGVLIEPLAAPAA
jgi:hypothetical protein